MNPNNTETTETELGEDYALLEENIQRLIQANNTPDDLKTICTYLVMIETTFLKTSEVIFGLMFNPNRSEIQTSVSDTIREMIIRVEKEVVNSVITESKLPELVPEKDIISMVLYIYKDILGEIFSETLLGTGIGVHLIEIIEGAILQTIDELDTEEGSSEAKEDTKGEK